MAFAQYDPKQVFLIAGGSPISGYADGTFIGIVFDEDQFNKTTGADGLTQRSKTNNYSGQVTVTLLNGSSGNDLLNNFFSADRVSNAGVFPLLVKDASGRTIWSAQNAWIRKMPDQDFAKEATERAWVIDTDELVGAIGGNQ